MRHDDFKTDPAARFITQHSAMNPIQTVAFGRGPVVPGAGNVNIAIARGHLSNGAFGQPVVGVYTDKHFVILVRQNREIPFQHRSDDAVLVPERYENGNGTLGSRLQVLIGRPGKGLVPGPKKKAGDEQVIETAQQDPAGQRKQAYRNGLIQPSVQLNYDDSDRRGSGLGPLQTSGIWRVDTRQTLIPSQKRDSRACNKLQSRDP